MLAENNGQPIGILMGTTDAPAISLRYKKIGKILEIYILPEYRRSGAGKLLFNSFRKFLKEKNISHVELSVDANNKPGIKFWESLGFKEYSKRMALQIGDDK